MKKKLNNLSIKSVILLSFLLGVVIGGSTLFYLNYSPLTQASSQEVEFKAEAYKDLVRFQAEGNNVSEIQVAIYDLSGRKVYQGESTQQTLDWYRTTDSGERLNKGTFLYVTKAFDGDSLVKTSGIGKMFVSSESIHLKSAPSLNETIDLNDSRTNLDNELRPQDTISGNLYVQGGLAYVEQIDYPQFVLSSSLSGAREWSIYSSDSSFSIRDRTESQNVFEIKNGTPGNSFTLSAGGARLTNTKYPEYAMQSSLSGAKEWSFFGSDTGFYIRSRTDSVNVFGIRNGAPHGSLFVNPSGNVGMGTTYPAAKLEVKGATSNLLALYNKNSTSSAKFRVENDGTVRADGTYYGADFVTGGGADVAERINTSEWVQEGNIVEIDPEHEGFFRKTKSSHSTKVAGVISSNPGVVLGNDNGSSSDQWEDNRPMLALTGRVPVKANLENGSITVGDLLVSSSQPGYAMKCEDQSKCTGAIVGKALEPLKEKSGKIMAQVSLS